MAGAAGGVTPGRGAAACNAGACPTTEVSAVISTSGASTIFSAETVMPFLKSNTVAGRPSIVNRTLSSCFTMYCLF